jgi:two-component system sensor histidine kinase KdpD
LSDADIQITTETRRRLAKLIDIQADRLAELVQSLLDMSRIQAGVLEPRCTIMLLSDLVNGVVRDLTSSMRGHAILVDIPSELPPIDVDIVLISRVLTNILMNAARHSPKGSSIAIGAVRNDAETIEVSVTDHGPGVPADRRDEIFGLLARRDNDTGAGLGLSIAKTFVEAHQQRIWVDNAADGGAVFSFTLPVAKSMPEELRLA